MAMFGAGAGFGAANQQQQQSAFSTFHPCSFHHRPPDPDPDLSPPPILCPSRLWSWRSATRRRCIWRTTRRWRLWCRIQPTQRQRLWRRRCIRRWRPAARCRWRVRRLWRDGRRYNCFWRCWRHGVWGSKHSTAAWWRIVWRWREQHGCDHRVWWGRFWWCWSGSDGRVWCKHAWRRHGRLICGPRAKPRHWRSEIHCDARN
ncbi:hypothetical protein BCR44DRAFT_1172705 [Catenaria anguillulae PL171]|uniref:Uncharacterized protein n=1 Tax=Catenaria anguillulae PL171 TaxID=765915 RepID=A0A1Y2I0F7_9FUNG|nr:hypothetical protein BCR44DRAFT_1172705 [Catenaria anguillulae PL171]